MRYISLTGNLADFLQCHCPFSDGCLCKGMSLANKVIDMVYWSDSDYKEFYESL